VTDFTVSILFDDDNNCCDDDDEDEIAGTGDDVNVDDDDDDDCMLRSSRCDRRLAVVGIMAKAKQIVLLVLETVSIEIEVVMTARAIAKAVRTQCILWLFAIVANDSGWLCCGVGD
jgi:hypothetical protein